MPYPALVIGADDTIVTANPAAESFGATSIRQMEGKPLGQVSRRRQRRARSRRARRVATACRWRSTTSIVGWSDQPPQPQNVHAAPLQDGDGEVLLLMHPQGMADKMDRSLGHRSAARSVTGMAAMLAHEIRNPLAGISGAAQLLEMGLGDADRELTGLIQAEAARIGKLVDRVEQFGDLRPAQRRPLNIHDVLDRARRAAQGRVRRARALLRGLRPVAAADRRRSGPAAPGVPEPAQERRRGGAARRRLDPHRHRLSARA